MSLQEIIENWFSNPVGTVSNPLNRYGYINNTFYYRGTQIASILNNELVITSDFYLWNIGVTQNLLIQKAKSIGIKVNDLRDIEY